MIAMDTHPYTANAAGGCDRCPDPQVFEYDCRCITDADMTETGYIGIACGADAVVVSLSRDAGMCLSCLRELRIAGAMPLELMQDVFEVEADALMAGIR